jgi:hypothetical protein
MEKETDKITEITKYAAYTQGANRPQTKKAVENCMS